MAIDDDLTILLFTRNRPHFLRPALQYWTELGVRVVVADGSDTLDCDTKMLTGMSDLVTLLHVPSRGESVSENYERRIRLLADSPTTQFCMFIGDDDRAWPSGLRAAIHELSHGPTVDVAIGAEARFMCNRGRPRFLRIPTRSVPSHFCSIELSLRQQCSLDDIYGVFNGVWRTATARKFFGESFRSFPGDRLIPEYVHGWSSLLAARVVSISEVVAIRSSDVVGKKPSNAKHLALWLEIEKNRQFAVNRVVAVSSQVLLSAAHSELAIMRIQEAADRVVRKYLSEKKARQRAKKSRRMRRNAQLHVRALQHLNCLTRRAWTALLQHRTTSYRARRLADRCNASVRQWHRSRTRMRDSVSASQFFRELAGRSEELLADSELVLRFICPDGRGQPNRPDAKSLE